MSDQNLWNMYIRDSNKKIWRTINNLLFMEYKSRNIKNNNVKNNMRKVFKLLAAVEIVINNNTFNDFTVEIMEVMLKIKLSNLEPMLDNFYNVIWMDHDNLELNSI